MVGLDSRLFSRHLDDDEELVTVIHRHWLLGLRYLGKPALSFAIAWGIAYLFPFRFVAILVAFWSIVSLVWLLRNFFDYYLDAWILSSEGVIDVEWHGWFHRTSTRVLYSDIQGVSYEIQGVVGTVMRYGTISIEKISTGESMDLSHVGNPRSVEKLILKQMEKYLHDKSLVDAKHVQEILSQLVAEQVQLRDLSNEEDAPHPGPLPRGEGSAR